MLGSNVAKEGFYPKPFALCEDGMSLQLAISTEVFGRPDVRKVHGFFEGSCVIDLF